MCPSSQREVASCGLSKEISVDEICCKDVEGNNKLIENAENIRYKRETGKEEGKDQDAKKKVPADKNKDKPKTKKKKAKAKKKTTIKPKRGPKRKILYGRGRIVSRM